MQDPEKLGSRGSYALLLENLREKQKRMKKSFVPVFTVVYSSRAPEVLGYILTRKGVEEVRAREHGLNIAEVTPADLYKTATDAGYRYAYIPVGGNYIEIRYAGGREKDLFASILEMQEHSTEESAVYALFSPLVGKSEKLAKVSIPAWLMVSVQEVVESYQRFAEKPPGVAPWIMVYFVD